MLKGLHCIGSRANLSHRLCVVLFMQTLRHNYWLTVFQKCPGRGLNSGRTFKNLTLKDCWIHYYLISISWQLTELLESWWQSLLAKSVWWSNHLRSSILHEIFCVLILLGHHSEILSSYILINQSLWWTQFRFFFDHAIDCLVITLHLAISLLL